MSEPQSPPAPDSRRPSRFKWWWLVLPALLAAGIYLIFSASKSSASGANGSPKNAGTAKKGGSGGRGGDAAIPVVGTRAQKGDISVYLNGLGAVTPLNTVTVRSRVDGQLMVV